MVEQADAFRSIRRPNVVEEIIESFKQGLIHGQLRPGQRLPPEPELAQRFGVGRNALREAMKVLEALGVVHIQQGDGTHIMDRPSSAMLSPLAFAIMLEAGTTTELFELRLMIESGYCQLAARNATAEDWMRIEEAARVCEACANAPAYDVEQWTRLDLEFHYCLLEATHNPLVIRLGRTVEELFFASIHKTHVQGLERPWISGHRDILSAMRSDYAAIPEAVEKSLGRWSKQLGISHVPQQRSADGE